MTPSLLDRIDSAAHLLSVVEKQLTAKNGYVSERHRAKLIDYCGLKRRKIPYWRKELKLRATALDALMNFESNVDNAGMTEFLGTRMDEETVKHLLLLSYLTASWSTADGISAAVGNLLLCYSKSENTAAPCQLVRDFIWDWHKSLPGSVGVHICDASGWPLAIFYSLRNAFVHEGGCIDGHSLLTATVGREFFRVDDNAWEVLENRTAKKFKGGPNFDHHDSVLWPKRPIADIRQALVCCEKHLDQSLGLLLRSACGFLAGHVEATYDNGS